MDTDKPDNLTGALSHSGKIVNHPKLCYLGIYSSIYKQDIEINIDILFSVSGPEIQRTLFEELILEQLPTIPGKKVVVLGKSGNNLEYEEYEDTKIYNYVNRCKMNELMNKAKFVVCRSGYTTVMELIALGKPALLIPTPGQTEQEYLAQHYQKTGLFHIAEQKSLNLSAEIKNIKNMIVPQLKHISINDTKKFIKLING